MAYKSLVATFKSVYIAIWGATGVLCFLGKSRKYKIYSLEIRGLAVIVEVGSRSVHTPKQNEPLAIE